MLRRNRQGLLVAASIALTALTVHASCARGPRVPARIAFQEVILDRQITGMQELIATMRDSSLIPADQALVIIEQDLVHDLLTAAIPFERDLANGIRVQVTSATVLFEDGLALVQLDGRAALIGRDDVFTEVSVYGDLNVVEFDPDEGLLRGRVDVIAFDEKKVSIAGLSPSIKDLIDDLSELGLADLSNLNYTIDIPVRLADTVRLPSIGKPGGDVYIREASIPMNVAVDNVKSFRGKLWITINVTVPEVERRGEGEPREGAPPQAPEPRGTGA